MTALTTITMPILAQSGAGKDALDGLIGGLNMEPLQLAIFTLVFGIVVILFALGTEFWSNLYGIITAPTVALSRIMGEQQLLPALFVVFIAGLATAIFALLVVPSNEYITQAGETLPNLLSQISELYASAGVPYASEAMQFELDDIRLSVMKSLGFFMLIPLTYAIWWYSWGVGYMVAGKLIGMRNAAGVNNVVCALAWPMLLQPLIFMTEARARFFDQGFMWGLYGLCQLIAFIWTLLLSREFFRVGWVPTLIGMLLAAILGAIVFAIGFTILVMFYGILKNQLPEYI